MNPTKKLLLETMAVAGDLEEFYLAWRALQRLDQLASQVRQLENQRAVQSIPQGPRPTMQSHQHAVYPAAQPPAGGLYNPAREPSFPEEPYGDEPLPWEGI